MYIIFTRLVKMGTQSFCDISSTRSFSDVIIGEQIRGKDGKFV